ncbi:MAG TPA: hypothetical protein VHU40_21640 [Polyangia bacterium]|jgi:hypothetical protein|nr:hypothetical protein [Polyangia bacterium]
MIRRRGALAVVLALAGCGGNGQTGTPGSSGGTGGADAGAPPDLAGPMDAIPSPDLGDLPDVPFTRPDAAYVPSPGTCGFATPAFCEDFEAGPAATVGRSGELDPARWSVARGEPYNSAWFDDVFRVGPALIGECRADLSNTRVLPDHDVLVCDPTPLVPTRHALAAVAEQNYGLASYRIRQPFDFAGRTGTIKLDMDLSNNSLGGWPALILSQDPSVLPSFDWQERGSGPRNGVEIEFGTGWCNTPHTLEAIIYKFNDYLQTSSVPSFDCDIPHATTAPGALNHVEIYVTQTHLEVWTSDTSPDGVTFPNLHLLWAGDVALPFSRGYVSLAVRNHATLKYWLGSAATVRFDNVGFDGPVVPAAREFSAPDSLTTFTGLSGCKMDGTTCQWMGDVIPATPGEAGRVRCAETMCPYEGEGRNVGYLIPTLEEKATPAAIPFSSIVKGAATRARLALAGMYPLFEWNGVLKPASAIVLRLRWNGGAWRQRPLTDIEANAFTDFSPELGGAGAGAGLLNQIIDVDLADLRDGDNLLELETDGTWTGTYRAMVTGVDLLLD